MYRRIIAAIIILLVVSGNIVYAANSSELLALYGVSQLYDVGLNEEALDGFYEEYYEAQQTVSHSEMLELAESLNHSEVENKLRLMQEKISELQQQVQDKESEILLNALSPVQVLFKLDTEYKTLVTELQSTNVAMQVTTAGMVTFDTKDVSKEKEVVSSYAGKVEEFTKTAELVNSYAELGNVSGIRYPLAAHSYVTSKFGNRVDPITGDRIQFHTGLDLKAKSDTLVLALFNGTVSDVGSTVNLGNYVTIDHGKGIKTIYGHLNKHLVRRGETVKQYEVIALSGNTGARTTGPHLHLSIYINGNPVDPEKLFY